MDVLSTVDGSAQAVRDAAQASGAADSAPALERELDRLNAAITAHSSASARHLQWTLLAQSVLFASYLFVLVGAWSVPLPGKRWLLAAIAAYGALTLAFGYLSQRGGRGRISPLRQHRQRVEQALERIALRPVVFSRDSVVARTAGDWATALLPVTLLAGWIALSIYTLALAMPGDVRAAAATDTRTAPRATPVAAAPGTRVKSAARKGDEPTTATAAPEPPPAEESGLAALFRRAINAPPPAEPAEIVKP